MNDKIIKLAGKGATVMASSLYKDKLSDSEKKERFNKFHDNLKQDLVRDVAKNSALFKNSFCNIKSNLKVVKTDIANEVRRTSSKGTSAVAGTFSHELAGNYMNAYNNYYRQLRSRNNANINLAREFAMKENIAFNNRFRK